jgi:ketosteroid isomerase-like protein
MKLFYALLVSFILCASAQADNHSSNEQSVLNALEQYQKAINSADWDAVVDLQSDTGTYQSNSDGSFHKPLAINTKSDWQKAFQKNSMTSFFYPEAVSISDNVVLVRAYSEGVIGGDSPTPYRTRVTMVWITENNGWVIKSSHWSPANFGGVHRTQATDFVD